MTDKANTEKRRVHVGGLFPTITASELSDKFSKFGNVTNVEIKIRKNENGTPEKTFAYVDFVSTEANWKKCMSTFNHSKWKGSELKLELAKPSFLDKLAEERQHNKDDDSLQENCDKSHLHNPLENLPDGQDFHLKGAVPGTPIPGEKNWVVGKYGRILPIMHLKKDGKQKLITHDPSKYCHSLKKLKVEDPDNISPTDLTWEITHTDSKVMKKQKGKFEPWATKKKIHTDQNYLMLKKFYDKRLEESRNGVRDETDSDEFEVVKACSKLKNDDSDSADSADTDEIIANTQTKHKTAYKHSDVNSEQDGATFGKTDKRIKNKLNTHSSVVSMSDSMSSSKGVSSSSVHTCQVQSQDASRNNLSYSSSDSDNMDTSADKDGSSVNVLKKTKLGSPQQGTCLQAISDKQGKRKSTDTMCTDKDIKSPGTKKSKHSETKNPKTDVNDADSCDKANMKSPESCKTIVVHDKNPSKALNNWKCNQSMVPEFKGLSMLASDSDNGEPPNSVAKCQINTGVNFSNSMNESADVSDKDSDHCDRDSDNSDEDLETGSTGSADTDDIISSAKKNVKTKSKVQSQKWWNSMDEYSTGFYIIDGDISYAQSNQQTDDDSKDDDFDDDFDKLTELVEKTNKKIMSSTPNPVSKNQNGKVDLTDSESSTSYEEESFRKEATKDSKPVKKQPAPIDKQSPRSSINTYMASQELGDHKQMSKKVNISSQLAEKKHADDNLKRLQSVKERDRENRMRKAILQKALSSVDGVSTANKKIIFDSDDDFDVPAVSVPAMTDSKTNDSSKQQVVTTGPSLFDSADENDDDDDKTDGDRFLLKQQYEGKSGSKLLALQSRIGADERFRLDERFADSEDEDISDQDESTEQSEKARNLKILESIVGPAKLYKHDAKKKQFKDIGAVRFDPAREDHSQLEIKRSEAELSKNNTKPEKQKKKPKKDKQEDVEPELPEVDKSRHFEVSSSLKDAFKKTLKKESFSLLSAFGATKDQSLSSDEEDKSVKTSVFLPWRQDFNSDDELMSASDNNENSSELLSVQSAAAPPKVIFPVANRTFFFTPNDERLKEGVRYFQRPADYEEVVRKWREKRRDLIDAFKLKHKRVLKRLQFKNKFHKNKIHG